MLWRILIAIAIIGVAIMVAASPMMCSQIF